MSKHYKAGCVFCDQSKIQAGDIRQYHLRGVDFISFTPLKPISLGHLVVVPVSHVDNASTDPLITGMAFELAAMIAKDSGLDDYNLIVNNGAYADQTVFHLHIHIVPRFKDDDTITIWNTDGVKGAGFNPDDRRNKPRIFRRT